MDVGTPSSARIDASPVRTVLWILLSVTAVVALYFFSRNHFLLFHTVVEVAGIGVAWAVFLLLWNARHYIGEDAYVVLGLALLGAGVLDLLHTVTFKGLIVVVADAPTDTPTQFWVAARGLETLGLLAFPLLLGRRGAVPWAAGFVALATTLSIHAIVVTGVFPTCHVEGQGLTRFKVASEFVMVALLALASLLIHRRREHLALPVYRLLQLGLLASIAAELVFTLYTDVHGITVAVGHYFRLGARLAIYLALVHLSIARPHMLLFRHLRQQQEQLEASQKRWRALSASSPDQTVDLDGDLRVRFANYPPAGLEMAAFLGRRYLDFIPPDDRRAVESVLRDSLARGVRRRYETPWRDTDGRTCHQETTVVAQDPDGVIEGLTLVIRDVTERRRLEELRAARVRIADHALEHDADAVLHVVLDEAAKLSESSLASFHAAVDGGAGTVAEAWSSQPGRRARGRPSVSGPGAGSGWLTCVRTARPVILEGDVPASDWPGTADHDAPPIRAALVPVVREDRVVAVMGVADRASAYLDDDVQMLAELADLAWDVVERKRAEAARDESERRLIRTFANLPGMVYRCANDARWTMEFISESCRELTGYATDEVIGNRVVAYADLIHPDDREAVDRAVQESLFRRDFFRLTYRVLHRDGRVMWFWEQGRGVFENDELVALEGFIYDISARVRAEEERRAMEQRVLQAQKLESLGVLAGGIAHDFNNLLQAMLGYVQLAELDLPRDGTARENLDHVKAAARRAAALTSQMLAYAGRGCFSTEVFDLAEHVQEMGSLLRSSVARTVELLIEPASSSLPVEADPGQIQQVVLNLVVNAAEACGQGSGAVRLTVTEAQCSANDLERNVPAMYADGEGPEPGEYVVLAVSDDGEGIAPDVLERIFDPFFSTKFTGRGLGLAAVLGILRDHRGALTIDTEPGRGSTFRMLLPRSRSVATGHASGARTLDDEDLRFDDRTVLVAEDELPVRRSITAMLERCGVRVLQAANGHEALSVFDAAGDTVDAVLLDLTMPKLGGERCLAALRQRRADLPVILMSGYSGEEIEGRFADMDVSAFLCKPFSASELRSALRAVVGRAR